MSRLMSLFLCNAFLVSVLCAQAGECSEPDGKNDYSMCNWEYSDRDDHSINCVDWNQARKSICKVGR